MGGMLLPAVSEDTGFDNLLDDYFGLHAGQRCMFAEAGERQIGAG